MNKNFVITIARGFGAGGKSIGTILSNQLGIPCYERQILRLASNYSGINENLFYQVDEKLRSSYLVSLLKKDSLYPIEPMDKKFTSDSNLYRIQCEIIRQLAKTESCIIIGKCADHVLQQYSNVVSVYVEAPRQFCIRTIQRRLDVSEEKAEQYIAKTDKYRSDYYKFYTGGKNWTNPVNYDLVLNSERLGFENCAEVIKSCVRTKLQIEL